MHSSLQGLVWFLQVLQPNFGHFAHGIARDAFVPHPGLRKPSRSIFAILLGSGRKVLVRRGPVKNRTGIFFGLFPWQVQAWYALGPSRHHQIPNFRHVFEFSNRMDFLGFNRFFPGFFTILGKLVQFSQTPIHSRPPLAVPDLQDLVDVAAEKSSQEPVDGPFLDGLVESRDNFCICLLILHELPCRPGHPTRHLDKLHSH